MKIEKLFEELERIDKLEETEKIFEDSGVKNVYKKLDYGFFPLGSGILSNDINKSIIANAEIDDGGIMILGNDFGIVSYVRDNCKENKEDNSPTIRNLTKKLGLCKKTTFYTNFYLGLRDDEKYPCTTMIKRCISIKDEYRLLCYNFFLEQVAAVKPRIIICLGHEVKRALTSIDNREYFPKWKPNNITIQKLYENDEFKVKFADGIFKNITFVLMPHPCYNSNLKKKYVDKILTALNECDSIL